MSTEHEGYINLDLDIEGLEEPRCPRQTPVRRLQALLWITYTLQQSGLKPEEFSRRYVGKKSNLFYKWTRGETCPGKRLVGRIDDQLNGAGVREIYDLPLFPLLEMRRHLIV